MKIKEELSLSDSIFLCTKSSFIASWYNLFHMYKYTMTSNLYVGAFSITTIPFRLGNYIYAR
jgi:hypothetical protein